MAEAPPEIPVFAWQETRFEWLWVYRAASAKQEVWSAPADIPNGVFFVEKGRVDIEAHGRRFAVPAGAAFFSAPGPRRHFFAAGTRLLSAGFRCRRPDGLPLYAKGLNLVASTARLRSLHRATVALYESLHGGRAAVDYHRAILPRPATLADRARRESAFFGWFAAYADSLAKLGPAAGAGMGSKSDFSKKSISDDEASRIRGLITGNGQPAARPAAAAPAAAAPAAVSPPKAAASPPKAAAPLPGLGAAEPARCETAEPGARRRKKKSKDKKVCFLSFDFIICIVFPAIFVVGLLSKLHISACFTGQGIGR